MVTTTRSEGRAGARCPRSESQRHARAGGEQRCAPREAEHSRCQVHRRAMPRRCARSGIRISRPVRQRRRCRNRQTSATMVSGERRRRSGSCAEAARARASDRTAQAARPRCAERSAQTHEVSEGDGRRRARRQGRRPARDAVREWMREPLTITWQGDRLIAKSAEQSCHLWIDGGHGSHEWSNRALHTQTGHFIRRVLPHLDNVAKLDIDIEGDKVAWNKDLRARARGCRSTASHRRTRQSRARPAVRAA